MASCLCYTKRNTASHSNCLRSAFPSPPLQSCTALPILLGPTLTLSSPHSTLPHHALLYPTTLYSTPSRSTLPHPALLCSLTFSEKFSAADNSCWSSVSIACSKVKYGGLLLVGSQHCWWDPNTAGGTRSIPKPCTL